MFSPHAEHFEMYFENVIGNLIQNIHLFQEDKVKENVHYLVLIDCL